MKSFQFLGLSSLSIIISQPAYAYLDPGTGSFILQMLIAGIMSVLFTIKLYWYKLKAIFARMMGKEIKESEDDDDDDEEANTADKTKPADLDK